LRHKAKVLLATLYIGALAGLPAVVAGSRVASAQASSAVARTADPVKRGFKESDFPRTVRVAENVDTYEDFHAGDEKFTTTNMFVVTNDGVLVADGQGSLAATKGLVDAIAKITPQPIKYVVICSDHGDHTAGNAAFPAGVTYVVHPTSKRILDAAAGRSAEASRSNDGAAGRSAEGSRLRSRTNLASFGAQARFSNDAASGRSGEASRLRSRTNLASFGAQARSSDSATGRSTGEQAQGARSGRGGAGWQLPANAVLVADRQSFTLGTQRVDVMFLGRAHTGGDLAVWLPDRRILFLSEIFLNRVFPAMRSAYPGEWLTALDRAQAMNAAIDIAGHGFTETGPVSREELAAYRRALQAVIAEAKRLHDAGVPVDDAMKQANFGEYANWTLAKSQGPIAIRRVYDELDGKLR
jgi:glyoxylase-like metal-dependent hydrolase (beta-lactamase superfamily II)